MFPCPCALTIKFRVMKQKERGPNTTGYSLISFCSRDWKSELKKIFLVCSLVLRMQVPDHRRSSVGEELQCTDCASHPATTTWHQITTTNKHHSIPTQSTSTRSAISQYICPRHHAVPLLSTPGSLFAVLPLNQSTGDLH